MNDVGTLIRHWRTTRRLSQQALADEAEISPRHLSCLETGRARPSREMVLVLCSALEVPLRERNTLLAAAGFTPAYRDTDLSDPGLAPVRRALEHLLVGAEPYGALVMNHRWDLLMANRPWQLLGRALLGRELAVGENTVELVLTELRPYLVDADGLACALLHRVHREATATGDPELHALMDRLAALPGVPGGWQRDPWATAPPVAATVDLQVGGQRWSLFTTLTTMGTPTDIHVAELRIEHYFPADAATDTALRALTAFDVR